MQPSDLHYEKADPVPGWDKSLWPKRGGWLLGVRLERWSTYVAGLLAALVMLAAASWGAAMSLAQLGWIAVPDALALSSPLRDPWGMLVSGVGIVFFSAAAIILFLVTMVAKAWQALRAVRSRAAPDPDYRVIDFRTRRKR